MLLIWSVDNVVSLSLLVSLSFHNFSYCQDTKKIISSQLMENFVYTVQSIYRNILYLWVISKQFNFLLKKA